MKVNDLLVWRNSGEAIEGSIPENIDVMSTEKILVPDIADSASFALDETGEYTFTSGYGITIKNNRAESPKYILVLQSQLGPKDGRMGGR